MSDLKDRLRGFYSTGPFGKRDFAPYVPQICIEAAEEIERLEQRLAAAEAKNTELEKELFIFASDVIYSENDEMPNWLVDKAREIYYRPRLGNDG